MSGPVVVHRAQVWHGDCLEVLPQLDAESVDACVCDPPYEIEFMARAWDKRGVAFDPATWARVYRVLKPGAHLVAFGGTRTYHRLACAVEDAGFEIRDAIMWHYASGFPKSHNIGKAIDRMAGAEREVVGLAADFARDGSTRKTDGSHIRPHEHQGGHGFGDSWSTPVTAPATPEAAAWEGWGTALKPATEIIVLARKPLRERTVAAQVLATGTGALNVDAARVPGQYETRDRDTSGGASIFGLGKGGGDFVPAEGRWPANLCHDGSPEVLAAFAAFGERRSAGLYPSESEGTGLGVTYMPTKQQGRLYEDAGTAARFFFSAKADTDDRAGSSHPTIKPLALMEWLVRLVTPPGGTVLDPFAGTGVTGEACLRQSFHAVLIEREADYHRDAVRRLGRLSGADTPLFAGEAA